MILLALLGQASAACPEPVVATEQTLRALIAGDFVEARATVTQAQAGLTCTPATPDLVAKVWLARGALEVLEGSGTAAPWLAAAHRLAPDSFDARLGPAIREAWQSATVASASLSIEPATPALLDGTPVTVFPVACGAGPHLVQVRSPDDTVIFGTVVELLPGEDALLETNLSAADVARLTPHDSGPAAAPVSVQPSPAASPEGAPGVKPPQRHAKGRVALGASAAVSLALGGAAALGAQAQDEAMEAATDLDTLDEAYGRQRLLAATAWVGLGAGALLAGGALFIGGP